MAGKKFKQRKTDVIQDGVVYRIYKGAYSVYTYTEDLPERVVVADRIGDVPVTFLGSKCLSCSACREVILPDSIEWIGPAAFGGCKELETISIPDSVVSVWHDTFDGCKNLKHTSFCYGCYLGNPENPFMILHKNEKANKPADGSELVVEVHPETKFILTSTFNSFSPDSAPYDKIDKLILHDKLESIDGGAFSMGFLGFDYSKVQTICVDSMEGLCRFGKNIPLLAKTLIVGGEPLGDTITIPAGVTKITRQCFNKLDSVKTVRFEGDISEIEGEAFCDCKNLREVYFPQKVGRIGLHAFSGCPALEKVELYEVEEIELGAFELVRQSWPGQKVELRKDGLRELVFNGRVGTIKERAFSNNAMLETVKGLENVESMESDSFCGTPFEKLAIE